MIDQPVAAMYLVSQELENLAGFAATMLTQLKEAISVGKTSAAYDKFKKKTGNCTAFTGRCDRIYYQTFFQW